MEVQTFFFGIIQVTLRMRFNKKQGVHYNVNYMDIIAIVLIFWHFCSTYAGRSLEPGKTEFQSGKFNRS